MFEKVANMMKHDEVKFRLHINWMLLLTRIQYN